MAGSISEKMMLSDKEAAFYMEVKPENGFNLETI
jgi:hypothetical protein